jgi:hypothetical protein
MWVRVGRVPGHGGDEALRRLQERLRALGYPRPPMRADETTGCVYLDVGVEGAPPEPVVRRSIEQVLSDVPRRPVASFPLRVTG